jgi:hypothetical protein
MILGLRPVKERLMIKSWTSGLDVVHIALIATWITLIAALSFASYCRLGQPWFAKPNTCWFNSTWRNYFLLDHLILELRPSTSIEQIGAEFYINRTFSSIRQGAERQTADWLINPASNWLISRHPELFAKARTETLTSDLILFMIASFLMSREPDWQLKMTNYTGTTTRMSLVSTLTSSKSYECTIFTEADVRSRLVRAHNLFATAPGLRDGTLCLPQTAHLKYRQSR